MQCAQCGLFFVDPYPQPGSRVEAVRHYDFGHEVAAAGSCYESQAFTQGSSLELIRRHCSGAKTLLDIGCGSGYLLERLNQETGLQTTGIELNPDRARVAAERSGRPILQIPIEEYREPTRFDIISFFDVFSHVFSVPRLFEAVREHLTDSGKFIMKTGELAADVRVDDVRTWEIPDHLQWLGLPTMDYVCRTYGFRKVEHRRLPLAESLFTRDRFLAPGRSRARNLAKKVMVYTPLALRAARAWYTFRHGCRVYNSFFVLERA
jgi:SAM-dependent methyltransferase